MVGAMQDEYWQDRWRRGRIGFHEGAPNEWLVKHVSILGIAPERRRVLVPLCGKTVDLAWLAANGAEVLGVELVDSAARAFFDEAQLTPARTVDGALTRYEAAGIEIVVGDFFGLGPEDVGVFDAYYDRASIVALPPELRTTYARTLTALTPRAPGLVVTFEHDADDGQPPFSVAEAELVSLFPDRGFEHLGTRDTFAASAALAERGATFVREKAYAARPRG
jgi:thiopurine S-methyltransferase